MLVVKNALLQGRLVDILVESDRIRDIVPAGSAEIADAEVFDASGMAALPAFYNTHNHAAMTLLRGYADDMNLQNWLTQYIWPYEDSLTSADIRKGSEIAISEMLRTGSVFFNDMYFDIEQTIDVVAAAGTRACIGITVMDNHSLAVSEAKKEFIRHWSDPTGGRIQLAVAPHAIYTVGKERLIEWTRFARENGLPIHIHVSETRQEVDDCIMDHGMTPVRYLDSIGVLGPDVVAAHCVHVDREEWDILASRGVTVAHCPCSNMKLGSGRFPYELALASGARITLGTDGCSSNNNLDMREEMKFAALLAKVTGDPCCLPASEVLRWATVCGAEAFGIDGGLVEPGRVADFLLADLSDVRFSSVAASSTPALLPASTLVSDWVYAASSDSIRAVFCAGRRVY